MGKITLDIVGGRSVTVAEGDLKGAKKALTNGNCHSLAVAIHLETGFPIVAFFPNENDVDDVNDENYDEYYSERVQHFAVLSPEGIVLDGDGAQPLDEVLDNTLWEESEGWTIDQLIAQIDEENQQEDVSWNPLCPPLVQSFVQPILDAYKSLAK
jgi:hypothetical protein